MLLSSCLTMLLRKNNDIGLELKNFSFEAEKFKKISIKYNDYEVNAEIPKDANTFFSTSLMLGLKINSSMKRRSNH